MGTLPCIRGIGTPRWSSSVTSIVGIFLWLQNLFVTSIAAETVYFNRYGHCSKYYNSDGFFDISKETHTIMSTGAGDAYESTACAMTFRTDVNWGVCLTFSKFTIERCDVSLKIYNAKRATGEPWRVLSCQDPKPNQMCTKSRYVTVQLSKETNTQHRGYEFEINVTASDSVSTGGGVLFASLGVLIVIGVVFLIAIMAATLLYCCRRHRSGAGLGRSSATTDEVEKTGTTNAGQQQGLVQPSAPPDEDTQDPPPPYVPPPPYEENSGTGRRELGTHYENIPLNR